MPERDWTSQSMVVLFCHVCLTMPSQSFRKLPYAHAHQSECTPFTAATGKDTPFESLEMPLSVCDNDCLAAFSPHTTLGKLAHLSFVKTLLPRLGSSQFLQPSSWMFLCLQLTLPLWGSTLGCLCGRGRTFSCKQLG